MSQVENSQELLTETFLNQRKHIALNSSLVVNLIENKIIALKSWQKRFAFHLNQSVESMNDPEIIDFVELFIVRGVLDKGSIKDTAIPDLVACIENFSRVKNNPNTLRWKSILNLFNTSTLSSALYEELAMVYFNQWVNETDLSSLKPKFCYKLSVVFKHTQHMAMFIKNSLKTCLETVQKDEEDEGYLIYPLLNKFTSMIIVCSFNWISPPGVKLVNIIDEAQAFNTIWEVLDEYHTEKLIEFDQIPFKRIFVAFLKQFFAVFKDVEDFGDIDKIKKKYEVLMMFANLFKKMNPSKYPAFAFAWLELISSPCFLPLMLNSRSEYNTQERWFKLQELFNLLFGFLKENIYENSQNSPALEKFFEGTLKVSLVVLHDYPEFFCCYYFQFINHLPLYRTGNLRNMILAAYPKNIRLPDPNAEITKFETSSALLGQDRQTLLQQFTDEGDFYGLKADLDDYLQSENDETLKSICERLELSQVVKNNKKIINTGIVHATMLYLAYDIDDKKTVQELEDPKLALKYEKMCQYLSTPVRDILLNAMFNELRLLNKSTVFFMNVLLHIFRNADLEESIISSQIARILIERYRIPKIHPWGLLAFQVRIRKEPKFISLNIVTQQQS